MTNQSIPAEDRSNDGLGVFVLVARICPDLPGGIGWDPSLTSLPAEGEALYLRRKSAPIGGEATTNGSAAPGQERN